MGKDGFLFCGNVEGVHVQFREKGFCLCGICGNPVSFDGGGNAGLFFVRIFSGTHRRKFYRQSIPGKAELSGGFFRSIKDF